MVPAVGGLTRVALATLRRKPWTAGLMVLGVALGVAVAVAVDIANTSALRAFKYSNAAVTGRATHQVAAGSAGLDERVYVDLAAGSLLGGFLLGLLASVAVAFPPAWEAAASAPRAALSRTEEEGKAGRSANRGALAGLGLGLVSAVLLVSPWDSVPVSFAGTLATVLAFALLTPVASKALMRMASPWLERLAGPVGRMAPRGVVNSLSRTGVAVSALMVAISVSIGVSLIVDSLRHTVEVWLAQVLTGDIYISAPGVTPGDTQPPIDPDAVDFVESHPWIERADALRTVTVRGESGPVELLVIDDPDFGSRPFRWTAEGRGRIWEQLQSVAVAVSEPFANRIGLGDGDAALRLRTPEGLKSFRVVGIYSDYGSSQGTVAMSMSVYRHIWRDDTITGLALRLAPGEDVDSRANWLADHLPHIQGLLVRPTRALREEALRIFERTFAITRALQLLAVLVAFIGVLSALLSLELEKQREFGLLRAIGLTSRGMGALITMETGLMGAVAGLLAMPTGLSLAIILIHIINRRFFGWTLQTQLAPAPFALALLIGVSAAILAGIYPSARVRAAERPRLTSQADGWGVSLQLQAEDDPVAHGDGGYSRKGPEVGDASMYYSFTRLRTAGEVDIAGQPFRVDGTSWMDHEWSTSSLSSEQLGWDWFPLQLDDGADLMLFHLRLCGGGIDPCSGGAYVGEGGRVTPLSAGDFKVENLAVWRSPASGVVHPARWRILVPSLGLRLYVNPMVQDQELRLSYTYWKGAVAVTGEGVSPSGLGYVELTGHAAPLDGRF